MMHKAWRSVEEVPYCFSRSSVKLQGHMTLKIVKFDPNWAFPDCNSSLNSLIHWKNQWFGSNLSKITRPVAAIKSLRFAMLGLVMQFANYFHSWLHHSWKLLANGIKSSPKRVIHGSLCIILYILHSGCPPVCQWKAQFQHYHLRFI